MIDFLSNAFTFPTLFYTGLLVLVVIYWLISIFGIGGVDSFDAEIEMDTGDNASSLTGWLTKFRLDGIPLTLSISLIVFISWILCFYMVEFFINNMMKNIDNKMAKVALGFWLLLLSPALALPIVISLLTPFKPLMKKLKKEAKGASATDFVGRTATIRSEKVNLSYGSVELNDGGAGLILQIRTKEPNHYKRGDKVILKEYLRESNTYNI